MSLYNDIVVIERTDEHIDRIVDLFRAYWKKHRKIRFEQAVNDMTWDYHYNEDAVVEKRLRSALGIPARKT